MQSFPKKVWKNWFPTAIWLQWFNWAYLFKGPTVGKWAMLLGNISDLISGLHGASWLLLGNEPCTWLQKKGKIGQQTWILNALIVHVRTECKMNSEISHWSVQYLYLFCLIFLTQFIEYFLSVLPCTTYGILGDTGQDVTEVNPHLWCMVDLQVRPWS